MKRFLFMILAAIIFSTLVNVLLTLETLDNNKSLKDLISNGQVLINKTLDSSNIAHENQKIIINNQKQIFEYANNQTAKNMQDLKQLLNNHTNVILNHLQK